MRVEAMVTDLTSQALEFVARLNEPDVSGDEPLRFVAWRAQSQAHEEAAQEAERVWQEIGQTAHARSFASAPTTAPRHAISSTSSMGRRRFLAMGAAAVTSIAGVGYLAGDWSGAAPFQTAVGERRLEMFGEGLSVWLNTSSAMTPQPGAAPFSVHLHTGEAYVDVAATALPFGLELDTHRLLVEEPSAFNVRSGVFASEDLSLFVERGRVRLISTGSQAATSIDVTAGEKVWLQRGGENAFHRSRADARRETGWRRGRLVFEGSRFSDVVAELDRYLSERLFVVGDALSDLKVTGIFNLDRPLHLLNTIQQILPVRVFRLPGVIVLF